VNNGVVVQPATADVRAHEKTENTVTTNELLTDDHGTTVDFGAAGQVGQAIKRWKPWERSAGPKTPDGKAAASQNGLVHGLRAKPFLERRKAFSDLVREVRALRSRFRGR
jgi:hypothetical protein